MEMSIRHILLGHALAGELARKEYDHTDPEELLLLRDRCSTFAAAVMDEPPARYDDDD